MQKRVLPSTNFKYFTNGVSPRLLIHAGTHGDEYESINIVTSSIKKFESLLPSFIYVPHVSPSAVKQKTRHNGNGKDSNRIYVKEDSLEDEVIWNQQIMMIGEFDLAVSFHEDPIYKEYYIYDEGKDDEKSHLIFEHNNFLSQNGIKLLTGIDDIYDPHLGTYFTNGYKKFTFKEGQYGGDVLNWGMNKGRIKHALIPEIPGLSNQIEKSFIINSFFEQVIVKYFS